MNMLITSCTYVAKPLGGWQRFAVRDILRLVSSLRHISLGREWSSSHNEMLTPFFTAQGQI